MFCAECGRQNKDGAKFCIHCGANLLDYAVGAGGAGRTDGEAPPPPEPPELSGSVPSPSHGGLTDTVETTAPLFGDLIRSGTILAAQFRILGEAPLGAGGMGEVWQAEDLQLGVVVAVKLVPPVLARNRGAIANLKREALIGRQLTHPNICRLYSFHAEGELNFIVMEYVDGRTLAEILAERAEPRMSWPELEPLASAMAEALDYAHNVTYADSTGRRVKGVLHRDVKPQNIMVTSDGTAKLMDFGIARELHNTMTEVTGRRSLTPGYASPEQFRGEKMTPASDLYSFAAVLYRCLSGRRLITPHGDLAWQVLHKPYEEIDLQPASVNAALRAGLAKDPARRPQSAREFIRTFTAGPAAAGAPPAGTAPIAAAQPPPAEDEPTVPRPAPAAPRDELTQSGTISLTTGLSRRLSLKVAGRCQMKFILLPRGSFAMGSPEDEPGRQWNEHPRHEVTIGTGRYVAIYQVTQEAYQAVMGRNPSYFVGPRNPVDNVTWEEAAEFCRKLSVQAARSIRLPTEAEWEYACRAGSGEAYCYGGGEGWLGDYAWYGPNSGNQTHPVGLKKPNAWGLYDLHGNVWEWCGDWFDPKYYVQSLPSEPQGPREGQRAVVRGGDFASDAFQCRSAHRHSAPPDARDAGIGFRVVLELK